MRTIASILAIAVICGLHSNAQILLGHPQVTPVHQYVGGASVPVYAQSSSLAHDAVIRNAQMEAQLPSELRSHIYDNPRAADGLARASWLTDKEMPVFERAAEKIDRAQIYKIVKNAGFINRRR